MRAIFLLLLVTLATAGHARPMRILSLNLCADQYLLALADRDQVVGLTKLARDKGMSWGAGRAGRWPTVGGGAEGMLAAAPDLIIADPFRRTAIEAAFRGRAPEILDLPPANSFDEIVAQIGIVSRAIGQEARGKALVRQMRLALPPAQSGHNKPVAAYYQRRGYLTGTGTLVDEIMARAGLENLARTLGKPPLSHVSVEEMVAARPDFLIVEIATDRVDDRGSELLHHPALVHIPRLRLPEAWTVCGGPGYAQAVRSLIEQAARHPRRAKVRSVR